MMTCFISQWKEFSEWFSLLQGIKYWPFFPRGNWKQILYNYATALECAILGFTIRLRQLVFVICILYLLVFVTTANMMGYNTFNAVQCSAALFE